MDRKDINKDKEVKKKHEFIDKVSEKELKKIRARNEKNRNIWFGLGMMGTIGWSVAIPTLIGIALGIWLDTKWPGRISWTLSFFFAGLILGCLNAWYWIRIEQKKIEGKNE
jgi:ATP synthase protein I